MSENLISIIVPIYGVEKYLCKCVDSILNQSYHNIEVVLVDDGSKDNCSQICDQYSNKDPRVVVIHKKNGGLVSARKAGIAVANGDYVVCVDGDDWIDEDYIETLYKISKLYSPDIICTGAKTVGDQIGYINIPCEPGMFLNNEIESVIYPILIQPASADAFPPSQWAKMYKKEIYKSCQERVNNAISNGEDIACVIPCLYKAKSIYLDKSNGYNYRYNPLSISKNKKPFNWDGPLYLYNALTSQIDVSKYDFKRQISQRMVREIFIVAASQFYSNRSYAEVKREIIKQLRDPIYAEMINGSCYKMNLNKNSIIRKFYEFCLRNRAVLLIWLYSHR